MSSDIFFNADPGQSVGDYTDTLTLRSDTESVTVPFIPEDVEDLKPHHHQHLANLPAHACSYCGIFNPHSVVKCNTCNKWFCNSKTNGGRSHIITHLILSRHNTVSLHQDSDLGDTVLECYNCGNRNVFLLGFVSAKQETVVVILCRMPCAQSKDSNWDTDQWQPLIEDKQLLSWVASVPDEQEQLSARAVTSQQIIKLESQWRIDKDVTIDDIDGLGGRVEAEDEILPILMRYNDAYQYQRSFGPLVKAEADFDKMMKESQMMESISVKWALGLNRKHLASFVLTSFESSGLKVGVGDEIILRCNPINDVPWSGSGYIIKLPNAHQEGFTLELTSDRKNKPPTDITTGYTVEFVWKGTAYDRMQAALKDFAVKESSVSSYIYHKLLGHDVKPVEFDVEMPENVDVPGFTKLNASQANAVRSVLQRPLSLIQGPPGTGKTVTSATIIYHLSKINKQKILVCAPSNVAVDHLTEKLNSLNLKVLRLVAKAREDVETNSSYLAMHSILKDQAKGPLKKLIKLKEEVGELSASDNAQYFKLLKKQEKKLLEEADIVCTTCVGAGDKRLSKINFRTVLIDEITQASEPESLIPIVKGAKQVILVGDHQQLGPVVLDKKAADAGLKQSLFERLIVLGHVPIRLEVQYRMNPYLSEFPSNMFYEGSLQNGVTTEQRTHYNSTFPWPIAEIPMMFWSNYGKEEISGNGTSFLNRIEAMNCEKVVSALLRDGVPPEEIGVVTPYEGQRAYIVQYMLLNGTQSKSLYADVEVASVDSFQGREKDYIIFSCVRANDKNIIGFLRDPRRLNVALTRARYGLVILGSPKSLCSNPLWNHLAVHFREKGCLVEGPLENLQLCTIQLRRLQYNNYGPSVKMQGLAQKDFDTESLASFIPESVDGDFRGGKDYNNASSFNGLPPLFNKKQWPSLAASVDSTYDEEGNYDYDSVHGTLNGTDDDEFYDSTNQRIDSNFSDKLKQLEESKMKNDLNNLTASFSQQLGLR